jgi:hypothetical protein
MTDGVSVKVWVVVLGLVTVIPTAAAAQPAGAAPRISVGAGAGIAFPFHGDFDFTPWAWDADVRIGLSRRLMFEAAVGEWRHTATRVEHGVPALGASGPIGTFGRLEQSTRRVQRAWQVNMLATGRAGRVRVFGGGGVGLLQHDRRFRQTIEDCSPSVINLCGSTSNTFHNMSGSAQGVGGADVVITGPLAAYGQARFIVPMTDPAGADLRITAGMRWGR